MRVNEIIKLSYESNFVKICLTKSNSLITEGFHLDLGEKSLFIYCSELSKNNVDYLKILGIVYRACRQYNINSFSWSLPNNDIYQVAFLLGQLTHKKFTLKTITKQVVFKDIELIPLEQSTFNVSLFNQAIINGQSVRHAINLGSKPANVATIDYLVNQATEISQISSYCKIKIIDTEGLKANGMNAMLSVNEASNQSATLVILEYFRDPTKKQTMILGKGVVYDTGGLSIKTANSMYQMHKDMMGAAISLNIMRSIIELDLPVNVAVLVGLVENAIGPKATRPGDCVVSASGKTIEIENTDAEGRLVLADLLTYAQRNYNPQYLITIATLTGGILAALGDGYSGIFSKNYELAQTFYHNSLKANECFWPMPMAQKYRDCNKSIIADLKNIPERYSGAGHIGAALFLQEFVNFDGDFIHLDVANLCHKRLDNDDYLSDTTGINTIVKMLSEDQLN